MFLFLQGDPGRGVYWLRKSDGPLVDHVVRGITIRSQDDFTEWNVAKKVDVAGHEANPPARRGALVGPVQVWHRAIAALILRLICNPLYIFYVVSDPCSSEVALCSRTCCSRGFTAWCGFKVCTPLCLLLLPAPSYV